ncbi:MAG: hypothetical protein RQ760_14000, partial [Sedimentisphaerales bacterium]|nr:hypothetical protein [Sedimentisphaerales bacterium]
MGLGTSPLHGRADWFGQDSRVQVYGAALTGLALRPRNTQFFIISRGHELGYSTVTARKLLKPAERDRWL